MITAPSTTRPNRSNAPRSIQLAQHRPRPRPRTTGASKPRTFARNIALFPHRVSGDELSFLSTQLHRHFSVPLNQRGRQLPRSVVGRVGPGVAQLGVSRRGRRFVVCASRSVWCKKTPDGGFVSCSSVASHLPARIPTAGSVGAMGSVVLPASGRCGPTSVIRASRPAAVVWRPIKKVGFLDLTTARLVLFLFRFLHPNLAAWGRPTNNNNNNKNANFTFPLVLV